MSKKVTTAEFIEKARAVHGDRYGYAGVEYTAARNKVEISCSLHGNFLQTPNKHLSGQGCQACGFISRGLGNRKDQAHFLERAQTTHGKLYDYSKAAYTTSTALLDIVCAEHGPFRMTANCHINGQGCPACGKLRGADARSYDTSVFVQKARSVHGERYDYTNSHYRRAGTPVSIVCKKHGEFMQSPENHLQGQNCPKCAIHSGTSEFEREIMAYALTLCDDAVANDRTQIAPMELDVFIPSQRVGIEANGCYWHSDRKKHKNYHRDKSLKCKEAGIRLIHITDADWNARRPQMERMIRNALGKSTDAKVNARQCEVRQVPIKEANAFLAQWHPQGAGATTVTCFGLYHAEHGLCALMTFGVDAYRRNPKHVNRSEDWGKHDLCRYTTSQQVRGGASKLFKHAVKELGMKEVQSFSAVDWFSGGLYETLGFQVLEVIEPDYRVWHPLTGIRGKSTWRRKNIPARLKQIGSDIQFDPDTDPRTEFQIEDLVGARRIWDASKIKWVWKAETKN